MTIDIPTREDYNNLLELCKLLAARVDELERQSQEGHKLWLSTDEVCASLNIAPRTLQKWALQGILKPRKVGRKNLYRSAEINKIICTN